MAPQITPWLAGQPVARLRASAGCYLRARLGRRLDSDRVARSGRLADDALARAQAVDGGGDRVEPAAGGERHVAEAEPVLAAVLRAQLHLDRDEGGHAHR